MNMETFRPVSEINEADNQVRLTAEVLEAVEKVANEETKKALLRYGTLCFKECEQDFKDEESQELFNLHRFLEQSIEPRIEDAMIAIEMAALDYKDKLASKTISETEEAA